MGQMGGGQAVEHQREMIRPLLQNMTVIVLFILPMVTMRTYSEEKRSGTIELLLTSPLTDLQIILGKFLGAMALYARHAGHHAASTSAILFIYGSPEWKPLVTAYLGLLLLGGCFICDGPVHLEPDQEPDRRRRRRLRRVPVPVGHQLARQLLAGRRRSARPAICRSSITSTTSRRASSTRSISSTT